MREIFLNWKSNPTQEKANTPLVGIRLDDKPPVECRRVGRLVFGGIIGMDRVGHVDAQDKGLSGAGAVKVGACGAANKGGGYSGNCVGHDSGVRALDGCRSNLFVVEEYGHCNVGR